MGSEAAISQKQFAASQVVEWKACPPEKKEEASKQARKALGQESQDSGLPDFVYIGDPSWIN
jgi:hypothetical protein